MQYDYHGEYPVTLRYSSESGVIGTWYQNQLKSLELMLEELEAEGQVAEVSSIRHLLQPIAKMENKLEASRRARRLAGMVEGYNALHVVEIVGMVLFEPLSNIDFSAVGNMLIEFDIENEVEDCDDRYCVHLDGAVVLGLSKWDGQTWVPVEEIVIRHATAMHDRFEGRGCTTTPVKPVEETAK